MRESLLHKLHRWVHRNKTVIKCFCAMLAATVLLIICIVVVNGGRKEVKAEEAGVEETTVPTIALPAEEPNSEPEAGCLPIWMPEQTEVEAIARTLYGECRGVESVAERAAVAWCILNRVDDPGYPDTVLGVVEQPYQFAYSADAPLWPYLEQIAADVLTRYHREKSGETDVGRTLPVEYLFFEGDGLRNWFTVEWNGDDYWGWSLPDPYEGE